MKEGRVGVSSVESAEDALKKATTSEIYGTGWGSLDALLGGGFRTGSLNHIFGKSGSGKSQLAMQTVLIAAKNGAKSLFIDTEGAFRPERLEEMATARGWQSGNLLEHVTYVRTDSSSEQMEMIRNMHSRESTASCRIVVVDTLTRNFSVELPGRANISDRQAALDVHLGEISREAYLGRRVYLLANRVTFGPVSDVGIGGSTVEQLVDTSIRLERDGARVKGTLITSGERFQGSLGPSGIS